MRGKNPNGNLRRRASTRCISFDLQTGTPRWSKNLRGAVRGGAASDGTTIYAGSTWGEIVALALDGTERWKTFLTRPSFDGTDEEPAEIYAAPTIVGDLLVVTFARDTYYNEPALVGIDRATGDIRWRALRSGRRDRRNASGLVPGRCCTSRDGLPSQYHASGLVGL